MKNLLSLKYRAGLDKVWARGERAILYMNRIHFEPIQNAVNTIIEEVTPMDNNGVHLCVSLATSDALAQFMEHPPRWLTAIVFPLHEEVKGYMLSSSQRLFSNVHANSDPLIVRDIETKLYLNPKIAEDRIWMPGNEYVPNRIDGMILFRKNPYDRAKDYPGFEHFKAYDPLILRACCSRCSLRRRDVPIG